MYVVKYVYFPSEETPINILSVKKQFHFPFSDKLKNLKILHYNNPPDLGKNSFSHQVYQFKFRRAMNNLFPKVRRLSLRSYVYYRITGCIKKISTLNVCQLLPICYYLQEFIVTSL